MLTVEEYWLFSVPAPLLMRNKRARAYVMVTAHVVLFTGCRLKI